MADDLKSKFISSQGEAAYSLDPGWESLLHLDPDLFSASLKILDVPKRQKHLSPKIQALIALSVDVAATHLYPPGIRAHTATALRAGASVAEINEILELSGTLGIHACNIGVPLLVEVLKEEGKYDDLPQVKGDWSDKQKQLKEDFTKNRGYWHTFWEDFLRLDPEFFDAYLDFSSLPWIKKVPGSESSKGSLEVCLPERLNDFAVLLDRKKPSTLTSMISFHISFGIISWGEHTDDERTYRSLR